MPNAIPPMPIKNPLEDAQGLMSQPWLAFFREVYNRIGGTSATSNTDLHDTQTSLTEDLAQAEANFWQGRTL